MAPSVDMLSLLPDFLLSVIVSLLPFKDAVRTSVLSKSWLNICKTTTNIEFNEHFFVECDLPGKTQEAQRKAFLDFITFWIDNQQGNVVEKLSLRLKKPENAREVVKRCIAFATQGGVKELELDFSNPWNRGDYDYHYNVYHATFELPEHVYSHSCLQYLKLFSCSFVETNLQNFHALKEVSLGWMEVKVSTIKALLSSCKMLESLSLKMCWNMEDLDLGEEKYLRLRKLVVDKCRFKLNYLFKLNAPNLRFFYYTGVLNFSTINLNSPVMEEAALDFSLEYDLMEGDGLLVYNLMQVLHNVRVLTVCSFLLQVVPTGGHPFGMQRGMNVRHLIMKMGLHLHEFLGITFFLNSCPALECLTIQLGCFIELFDYEEPIEIDYERFWIDNGGDYKCMTSTLKEVEIKGFKGTKNEIRLLKYFIINGKVLKKISIDLLKDNNPNEDWSLDYYRRDVAEGMKKVPKSSSDLEILISS